MTDQGVAGAGADVDPTLRREAAQLAHRFPDVDPDEIVRLMCETYARLDQEATVKVHLVTITVGQVGNRLREISQPAPPGDGDQVDGNESVRPPTELEADRQRAGYEPDGPDDLFQRLQQSTYGQPAPETDHDTYGSSRSEAQP